MKILLLMCHYIGDTFWALQTLDELKKIYPNSEIWIGTKSRSFELVENYVEDRQIILLNNVISDRHREKFSLSSYLKELRKVRKEKFDVTFDLSCNRYSAIFLKLSGIQKRVGLSIHKLSFLYTDLGPKFSDDLHLYKRPYYTIKAVKQSIQIPACLTTVTYKKEINDKIKAKFNILDNDKIALISPGAGWDSKRWDIKNFAECGKFLLTEGYRVIITGSKNERELCEKVNNLIDNKGSICTEKLNDFLALGANSKLILTNDSSPAHLIASLGISTFCIFTETNKDRYYPIGNKVFIFDAKKERVPDVINAIRKEI